MSMFQRLVEYKEQHGNTAVPHKYGADPQLRSWVTTQHSAYKNDKLLPNHRYARLNSVGFK